MYGEIKTKDILAAGFSQLYRSDDTTFSNNIGKLFKCFKCYQPIDFDSTLKQLVETGNILEIDNYITNLDIIYFEKEMLYLKVAKIFYQKNNVELGDYFNMKVKPTYHKATKYQVTLQKEKSLALEIRSLVINTK